MKFSDLPHPNSAIAIFPCVAGFGWMIFDGPLSPVDWGVSTVAKSAKGNVDRNARCVAAIELLLRRYRPATLILEQFEGGNTRRHGRIQHLCRSILSLAAMHGESVRILSRAEVRSSFASSHVTTRYEIAKVVASYLREINHRLPRKRKLWESETPDMALFAAAALLIIHYANPVQPL